MNHRASHGPQRALSTRARVGSALLVVLAAAACSPGAAGQATAPAVAALTSATPSSSTSPVPTESPTPPPIDALIGTWDTGPHAPKEFAGQEPIEWRVRFYREDGVPFVTMVAWDPTKGTVPADGDHGPYRLLPGGEIAIASADQPEFLTVYRYELAGDALTLTWLRNDPLGPDASDTTGSFGTIQLQRH